MQCVMRRKESWLCGMQAYLASEVLGPSDTWHCPKCREDVRAKKALDLWCLPEVLIIHL